LLLFTALNGFKDFSPMDLQLGGSLNTQFNGLAVDANDGHDDSAIDNDAFV
jgi:hypothetical protein